MTKTVEEAGKVDRDFVETNLATFASIARDAQAIAGEASDYAKTVFDTGLAAVERLLSAKSVEKVFEIQSAYAKQSYEGFVAGAARISELYTDLAKDAYRPFETIVVRAK